MSKQLLASHLQKAQITQANRFHWSKISSWRAIKQNVITKSLIFREQLGLFQCFAIFYSTGQLFLANK
tara:strand:+ start:1331 stop:1534 length:204 start_codon:yes stop_codon:yes gene_type:complete